MRRSAAAMRARSSSTWRCALGGRRIGREMQRVVDDAEVVLVVQEAGVGVDLRIDADPELHVALELPAGAASDRRRAPGRPRAARRRRGGPHEGECRAAG